MRYFNTAGPCRPDLHYMVPAMERLPEARTLAEQGMYFVVHAPRQTGKTTTLMALAEALTASGKYAALHFSCESGEPAGDDYAAAQEAVLATLRIEAESQLPGPLRPPRAWPKAPKLAMLQTALVAWARKCPRPLVLIFDEIDALRGESFRSVLRQLRTGYARRPKDFPHSVILCGLRDVRDYKAASGGDPSRLGTSSPFNIKVDSLRLGDFSLETLAELYRRHELEAGQPFTKEAVERAFELTQGQPWLVNALAREILEKMRIEAPAAITAEHVEEAYIQGIVNGAGYVDREYGVGRGRIDLLVRWPYKLPSGERKWQREAVELKVWRQGKPDPRKDGLAQLEMYLERMGLDRGHLVIFDRRRHRATAARRPLRPRPACLKPARTPKGLGAKVLLLA
ncbi:MAG: ATP-binding protein [Planctomycetes bacterium]|nr:ATP-binding protein [Planctomycetota bacterium]